MSSISDDRIADFLELTGTDDHQAARFYLEASKGDLNVAVSAFLENGAELDGSRPSSKGQATSSRSMASTISSKKPAQKRATGGIKTLGSLARDNGDDESDDEKPAEFYTGGEKSGLGVIDPESKKKSPSGDAQGLIEQILRKAQKHGAEKTDQQQDQSSSRFKGAGYTLGSDEAESTKVEDPNEAFRRAMAAGPPQVKRVLKLWKDGFSVDNGPLFRYDDPANKEYLEAINQGQAPLAVLNIQRGQHVDVTVQVSEEAYTAPPKEHKPFENQGHRLGSEIPPSASASTAAPAQSTSTTATPTMDVDESQPQTQLNIRLAAGGRLVSAFNRAHTIDDVYGFIDRGSPDSAGRNYVLLTPFPRREYPRGSKETLEAAGLLKGTLQQKFS